MRSDGPRWRVPGPADRDPRTNPSPAPPTRPGGTGETTPPRVRSRRTGRAAAVWAREAPAWGLMALVVVYRVGLAWLTTHGWVRSGQGGAGDWAPNFCPLAALALGGGTFFSRRLAWAMPLAVTLVSDQVINLFYGQAAAGWDAAFLSRYVCLLALGVVGRGYRSAGWDRLSPGPRRVASFLVLTAVGSTAFYLVTNTFCWWGSRDYPQTVAGWLQALTTGLPGYPPTWIFFRNALVSDLLYSMVLAVSMGPMPRRALAPVAPSAWCLPPRNPGPLGPGRPLL